MSKLDKFNELVQKSGDWLQESEEWESNLPWLQRSQAIALKVYKTIKEKGLSQKQLAEKLGVSPQQVSKIVKGKENLTLSTISKLEKVLGIELIAIAENSYKDIEVKTFQEESFDTILNQIFNEDFEVSKEMMCNTKLSFTYGGQFDITDEPNKVIPNAS